jgi:CHAD domain-containing protein/adenylate cyclase class IV
VPLEVEWKLLAPADVSDEELADVVRDAGLTLSPPSKRHQVDRYLDTPTIDLVRHDISLRLRESGAGSLVTLKMRVPSEGPAATEGAWTRLEIEEPVRRGSAPPERASELPERLRHYAEPFALGRPLVEVARLQVDRTLRELQGSLSGVRGSLAVDRVRVSGQERAGEFTEVELEVLSGDAVGLARLASDLQHRLGLVPSASDKLTRALALAGIEPPAPGPAAPGLVPEMRLREAAARILTLHLSALAQAEPVARLGEDVEGVHRMRVATRRMRATFRLFADAFPPKKLERALSFMRKMGSELGRVRDLDVMLEQLPALSREVPQIVAADLEPLRELLVEFHGRERRRLVAWLSSAPRLARAQAFQRFATGVPLRLRGAAARPLREVAPVLLESATQRVFRRGAQVRKNSPPERLHALRIAAKRLRYTAEALAELYGEDLARCLRRMVKLQDVLGAYNDAHVAQAVLSRWIDTPQGRRLPRRTLVAVGSLIAAQDARADQARRAFRKAWRDFSREKVRLEFEALGRLQLGSP